jgi:predicted dehydrogenase
MRTGYNSLAARYVDDGDLGDLYQINVRYYRRRGRPGLDCVVGAHWFLDSDRAGGGIIMDMGQYFMDAMLNIAGWPTIEAVSGATFRGFDRGDLPEDVRFDVEEHCTFLARAEGGLTLLFDLAWIAHHTPVRRLTLLGTEGGIRIDKDEPFTFYANKGGPWNWMNTTTEWKDNRNGNQVIYEEMIDVLRGGRAHAGTTPQQALAITELTLMALKSGKEGREVRRDELE